MSFNAAMLEAMQDEGLDLSGCIRVLRAAERGKDTTNAERQARHRAKKKADSNGVTVTAFKGSNDIDILTSQTPPQVISDEITPPIEIPNSEVSPENVIEAWNVMAGEAGVPKAKMTPERRKKLKTFVKRHPADDITEAIWAVPRTPFLRGENPRGWKANIDFMLQPSSFTKIIEGSYGE